MLNPKAYANASSAGFAVLQIVAKATDTPRQFVPLKRTIISGEVAGPVAYLKQAQLFRYSKDECDQVVEAIYRCPLPGDAAITGVKVRFGESEITAVIKEREEAEKNYKKAKDEGRQAAMLTKETPDVFTLRVSGLQPDQDVIVETDFALLNRLESDGFSLRLPLTTSPRYTRTDEENLPQAQGQPLLVMRDPGHRFSLDLLFHGQGMVHSRTHLLSLQKESNGVRVSLHAGEVIPDRDCVLYWQPERGARAALTIFEADDENSRYFLALISPPADDNSLPVSSRESIILVDHSGSMSGAKWQAADWAVDRYLYSLVNGDSFNLCLFWDANKWFSDAPVPANSENIERARQFLRDQTSGGTELGVALEQALSQTRAIPADSRNVLIITDAEVSDGPRILQLVQRESEQPERRRISVLCIDAAPNAYLAQEMAIRGGGIARFLTSDPNEEDVTTALEEICEDWAQPVMSDIRFEVNKKHLQTALQQVQEGPDNISSADLGDLPRGRALWLIGLVPGGAGHKLLYNLASGNARYNRANETEPVPNLLMALKAIFGVRRVTALEELLNATYSEDEIRDILARLGYDPKSILLQKKHSVYPESHDQEIKRRLRRLLVSESLRYNIASSATAFFAERTEAGEKVKDTILVGNALPAGWSDSFMSPAVPTATVGATPAAAAPSVSYDVSMGLGSGLNLSTGLLSNKLHSATSWQNNIIGGFSRLRTVAAEEATPEYKEIPVYTDSPAEIDGSVILFTAETGDDRVIPGECLITGLTLHFPNGTPGDVDEGIVIKVYVDDLASPKARIRVADLMRIGKRPLNLRRNKGAIIRLVLEDAKRVWEQNAPVISVSLDVSNI